MQTFSGKMREVPGKWRLSHVMHVNKSHKKAFTANLEGHVDQVGGFFCSPLIIWRKEVDCL